MRVTIEDGSAQGVAVMKVHGDLDMVSVPDVELEFDALMSRGVTDVVLDLGDVSYADSSALGLIVWMDRRLSPHDGRLVLAGADRNVTRVLEMSGLVGLAPTLSTAESPAQAIVGLRLSGTPAELLWREELSSLATPEALARMRDEVCAHLAPLGIAESMMFDIRVAVGEAVANAIRHGSPRGERDTVSATVVAYSDRVVIEVTDEGAGFAGDAEAPQDVYASSGRGVLFMRALMDQVEFHPLPDGGTRVTLVKGLALAS